MGTGEGSRLVGYNTKRARFSIQKVRSKKNCIEDCKRALYTYRKISRIEWSKLKGLRELFSLQIVSSKRGLR